MHGFLAYLAIHALLMVILENVDTIDESDGDSCKSALNLVVESLQGLGMPALSILTDAALFGHPSTRRRFFITALRETGSALVDFSSTSAHAVLQKMQGHLAMCLRTPPCLSEVLCKPGADCIEAELAARISTGSRQGGYHVASTVSMFQGLGIGQRWGQQGQASLPDALKQSDWFPTLPPGQRSALLFSFAENAGVVMMRDISQSCGRIRYSNYDEITGRHVACTQMPQQIVWLHQPDSPEAPDRLMLGRESMTIQGFPLANFQSLVAKTSENTMGALGGNMMASGVLLAILQSLFAVIPWSGAESAVVGCSDINDALGIFMHAIGEAPAPASGAAEDGEDDEESNLLQRRVVKRGRLT